MNSKIQNEEGCQPEEKWNWKEERQHKRQPSLQWYLKAPTRCQQHQELELEILKIWKSSPKSTINFYLEW